MGGSFARPAVGASLPHLCRRQTRLRVVLAREASRRREGSPAGRADGRAGARPSRRPAHDGPARSGARSVSATRSGTPRRPGRSRSAGRVRERRSCGRSPLPRSTRPKRVASSLGATSTSSGRPRLTGSPAGRGSRGARRPLRSPRSGESLLPVRSPLGDEWLLADDEPAMRAAETAAAPARLLPSGDAYFLLDGAERELLVPEADQRQRLWTSRVWPGALLVDGEIRGTWRRAQPHRADRGLGAPVAWRARRRRGRGRRAAASGRRPAHRGGLEHLSVRLLLARRYATGSRRCVTGPPRPRRLNVFGNS